MTKLLILPGNRAIRQNPNAPEGFPGWGRQELLPGVQEALEFYENQGYSIAVCENAGGIEKGITPLEKKISEFIELMKLAPQIDNLFFCPDFQGKYAYLLSKAGRGRLPELNRLRNVDKNSDYVPEESSFWTDIHLPNFRKPSCGMLTWLIRTLDPSQTVIVWERPEDKQAAEAINRNCTRVQSARFWRNVLDPFEPETLVGQVCSLQQIDPSQNTNKFWKISLEVEEQGFAVCTTYGRIGTTGKVHRKLFTQYAEAVNDRESRISEKFKRGYTRV